MDIKQLKEAVKHAAAIRGTARLQPIGGKGDKVFPPSHAIDDKRPKPGDRYASETRRIDGEDKLTVLLDSVQSQANRMELCLDQLFRAKRLQLPVIDVLTGLVDLPVVSSLTAPHRICDALLRDSVLDTVLFRNTELGQSFVDSSLENAAPMFKVSPTALLFGVWDSTGPKGGMGFKIARSITSEIVAIGSSFGVKTQSRIDPTNISKSAGVLYEATNSNELYTLDASQAKLDDKKKPILFKKKGSPAEANLGNIPPSTDAIGGGITFDYATQTSVLSLTNLRRLRFGNEDSDVAAQTVLVALGLVALTAQLDAGYFFRSRCELIPETGGALKFEVVSKDGSTHALHLDLEGALKLYAAAVEALPAALKFGKPAGEPLVTLKPSDKLAKLIVQTRKLGGAQDEAEE